MKQIKVTIGPTGVADIDAEGFTGTGCRDATKGILDALADPSAKIEEKPEMHMLEEQTIFESM